ncbi:MAG TPA: DUF1638 domain-containing protein [Terriglobia bacterium]|nr:DUF1638 domain-containing protein [Terriglobia bacterium]
MRLKLLSCEIFYREFCAAVARSPHLVDLEFLTKGLHDVGSEQMLSRLQAAVNSVDASKYEAILLGYGLCNNGLVGLTAPSIPLVVPRAHDCITLFLGSKERYLEYFQSHPGTYFQTTGWIERGGGNGELTQLALGQKLGTTQSYADLVAKYGEDNAKYLWETIGDLVRHYGQLTFIQMGIEPDTSFEERSRKQAESRGWKFEKLDGDMNLIQRLVNGSWEDSEFLVVPPGKRIAARYDGDIISTEASES